MKRREKVARRDDGEKSLEETSMILNLSGSRLACDILVGVVCDPSN